MFQDDVGLAQQKLISQETANSFSVNLVELVVVEGGLEATQTLEDLQYLTLRVPILDVRVLAWHGYLLLDRPLRGLFL